MWRGTCKRHNNDMANVHDVFFWQKAWGLDISFTIGIQTLMQWFGHWSLDTMEHFPWMPPLVSMSKSIICLQFIMFDHHRQGLLVAWVIHKSANKS